MNGKNKKRDIYIAIAEPTRRKLLRLLAEGEVLSFKELIIHFDMGLLRFQSIWQSLKMQAS
ncbi:hypothetical protein P9D31_08970 [Bacillus haynesii]|uniref:hypothetical protein n=1 Tax=Bacillus haynesii TaxID=1925021 RepID=UPI0022832E03|nr:hypothetical protein [Bacillus haynesii]MCY8669818.1 hypothetical protein [Bacillus haynesii]MEC1472465.1 hypothetical protein [Bacillus haynesii]MEC1484848.1 hypothetical protein [Bacillus haynesii]